MHDWSGSGKTNRNRFGKELMKMPEQFGQDEHSQTAQKKPLYTSLEDNIAYIVDQFNETDDLIVEDFFYGKLKGKLLFLNTMADPKKIDELLYNHLKREKKATTEKMLRATLAVQSIDDFDNVISEILKGSTVLILQGESEAFSLNTAIERERQPVEPDTEKTVRGSHLGFVEDLNTNLYLLRNRIQNNELKITYLNVGFESKKNVAIVYFDHIANKEIVNEVIKKVSMISIDTVFSPGYIEECIETAPFSPFPQNLYTERPDRVEAHLMEGRVAIFTDGSTEAIILPVTFFAFFQSPDDYNIRFIPGTVFRLLRLFSFFGVLLLPPLYIAFVSFHFEIIPYELVSLVKGSVSGVPLLPFFEAMFMAITVELIREAGVRLPTPIGETIGIVGGIIISDAVVSAGLVSNVMVIVVALTAIMSFTISTYEMGNAVRIANFPIMVAAALFGFAGIVIAMLILTIHLCKLESYGVPYLSPLTPLRFKELMDSVLRLPIWLFEKRPKDLRTQKDKRQYQSREWFYD